MKLIFWITGLVLVTLTNCSCKNKPKDNSENIDTANVWGQVENQILNGDSIVLEYQNLNNRLDNLLALRREKIDSIRILQLQIFPKKQEKSNPKPKLKEVKSQQSDEEIEFLPENEQEYTQIFEDRKPIDTSKFLGLI
jgi:ribosomal protein L3